MALTGRVQKTSVGEAIGIAINEFIIGKQDFGHMITASVYVDDELMDTYVADGILVSTPTGSTAYNLSAAGPVLVPSMEAMIITPICPHSLNKRSLVVSSDSKLRIEVGKTKENYQDEAAIRGDGQMLWTVSTGDVVWIEKAKETFELCQQKIKEHDLNMFLIDCEYTFDRNKLIFYFTAEGRVDFRDLVKDLASVFKTRIELRQIGVRDEVRRIGGNGICGRELCCCSFLGNFETVSIKMAKEQNISLNPAKISGNCGRLMCCLKYEQEVYEEKLKRLPKVGAIVKTEDGEGTVEEVETLKEKVKVKVKDGDDYFYKKYDCSDIKIIKNIEKHKIDPEEKEHQKELEELEKLEKTDTVEDDIE